MLLGVQKDASRVVAFTSIDFLKEETSGFQRLTEKNWEPTEYSWICSSHFVGGVKSDDPSSPQLCLIM